jgi:MFS family permease
MDDKLLRKISAAFYSAILFVGIYSLILLILSGFSSELFTILIVFFFALIGNFMYAIPVSILSDKLTRKFTIFRFGFSAFLHIFFACLTYLLIGGLSIYAIACAVLFLLTDEWLSKDGKRFDRKGLLLNWVFLSLIVAFAVFFTLWLVDISETETNDYYLIPKGYEGEITILYNIKHAPEPQKIDGFKVINVNEQGYGITSLPESKGIIKNKYYYIDELGNKEK